MLILSHCTDQLGFNIIWVSRFRSHQEKHKINTSESKTGKEEINFQKQEHYWKQ